jgi:hypothetical protein
MVRPAIAIEISATPGASLGDRATLIALERKELHSVSENSIWSARITRRQSAWRDRHVRIERPAHAGNEELENAVVGVGIAVK